MIECFCPSKEKTVVSGIPIGIQFETSASQESFALIVYGDSLALKVLTVENLISFVRVPLIISLYFSSPADVNISKYSAVSPSFA